MAYFGTTAASSIANPPRLISAAPLATNPAIAGSTAFLSTQGSTAVYANAPGGGGGNAWIYTSTNLTTDIVAANFFSDGFYIGMRPGDLVMGTQFSSANSSAITFQGSIVAVSTAGASLSTGSLLTSTFN